MFDLGDYQRSAVIAVSTPNGKDSAVVDALIRSGGRTMTVGEHDPWIIVEMDLPTPTEIDYEEQQIANIKRQSMRTSLIAAAAGALFGSSISDFASSTGFTRSWNFFSSIQHTDYQFSYWPRKVSVELLKKGHYQQAQQTRWKTLQKRNEKKTKRAKGKVPVYPQ